MSTLAEVGIPDHCELRCPGSHGWRRLSAAFSGRL